GLDGSQESPMVATPGTGFTTVTYDDVLQTLRVQATFADLIGLTTASHIHIRPAFTPNGGVATQTPSFFGFPLGVTSGSYNNSFDLTLASSWNPAFITANGGNTAGAEAAFFAGLQTGRAYLNVHTNFAPGGEIRGNLAAVPEPATWAMMLLGFGAIGFALRRRKRTELTFRQAS
ncbi:MAG TPA: CHRD domain-containing protein, partial [Sphingomicrobium sp.]|nr:CHRD domain-containing protein [Sphingomicrobium sp.]